MNNVAVLRYSSWGVDICLFKGSDLPDTDLVVLRGQIILLSTWILDIVRDHIDA